MTPAGSRVHTAKIVTATSIALLAASSAGVMLLFLSRFGASTASDGALAAYSAYVLTTVFAQGCRITGAAATGGARPRVSMTELAWTLAFTGVGIALLFALAADPLANLLTATGPAQIAARDTFPILGLGVAAQFFAVGWAIALGGQGRVAYASAALGAGGIASLVGFELLVPSRGVSALGWSTVISGGTACLVMAARQTVTVRRVGVGRLRITASLLMRENLVPLFSTTVYAMALVIAGTVPGDGASQLPGGTSAFALAFLACSYLCGILGTSVAIVDTIELNENDESLAERLRGTVPAALRIVVPLSTLVLAVAALAAPVALRALGPTSTTDQGGLAGALVLALAPFTLATLATNVAFSCWFSAARVSMLNRGLIAALPLGAVSITIGFLTLDLYGTALGVGMSTTAFAWWALRPAPDVLRSVARQSLASVCVLAIVAAAGLLGGAWT